MKHIPTIYKIEDLRFSYAIGNGKKGDAQSADQFQLGPIDLSIKKGKMTSILGRSGSGKTTLLSLIGLLRQHEHGKIFIDLNESIDIKNLWKCNRDIENFRANHLGFALQRGELLPYLSVYENAALVSRFLNRTNEELDHSINGLFDSFYSREKSDNLLAQVLNNKPLNVSQGQYQRAAVVRALANDPDILLADEPTGNLDKESGEEAMGIFQDIVRMNPDKSVIVVTHDQKLAADFADEIITLKNGLVSTIFSRDEEGWVSEGKRIEDKKIVKRIYNAL